jgi:hypothetical protein
MAMVIGDVEGEIPTQITSEMKCREQQCLGISKRLRENNRSRVSASEAKPSEHRRADDLWSV